MTVCRYFQQGNCHFGERCRFEHPRNNQQGFGGGGGGGGGGGFGNNVNVNRGGFNNNNRFASLSPGGQQPNKSAAQPNIKDMTPREIADIIAQEMKVWDSSKMWPFSCFTYSKDGQCISGFEDLSPEELRMEAYETQKNNTFHLYQQKVMSLALDYKQKRAALKTQPPDIKQKLLQEIQAHKSGIKGSSSNTFGSTQFSSGPPTGLFGNNPPSAPAQTQGLFGKPATSSQSQVPQGLFGNKAPSQTPFGTQQSVFGQSAPVGGSAFGGTAAGQPTAQAQPSNPFGAVQPQATQPTTGVFGQQQQQPQQQQQQQPFQSNQPPTGLFGKPATQPTVPTGLFSTVGTVGTTTQPVGGAGLFGKGPPAPAPAPAPTGLFGKPPQPGASSVFGGNPAPPAYGAMAQPSAAASAIASGGPGLYTPLDQLTDEEKAQFTAPSFELGRIPTRPPAREMV